VGDCAKTCGVFAGSYAVVGPVKNRRAPVGFRSFVASVVPVDVSIAGCPPEPADILRALLDAFDRLVDARAASSGNPRREATS